MRLVARQDIDAPIETVFREIADVATWERTARSRGVQVTRTDALREVGPGLEWDMAFPWRGRMLQVAVILEALDRPTRLVFAARGENLGGTLGIDLMSLAALRTRVTVRMEIKPQTVLARIFVQTLKLGRSRLEERFRARIARIAAGIEGSGPLR